jgi:hypothetical protein
MEYSSAFAGPPPMDFSYQPFGFNRHGDYVPYASFGRGLPGQEFVSYQDYPRGQSSYLYGSDLGGRMLRGASLEKFESVR